MSFLKYRRNVRNAEVLSTKMCVTVEFKGHCLLEGCRQADPSRVKKYLSSDVVNFKHPYTGDTPLVSKRVLLFIISKISF